MKRGSASEEHIPSAELARFLSQELGEDPGGWGAETGQPPHPIAHEAPLWLWRGKDSDGAPTKTAWFFITIDGATAQQIRAQAGPTSGFGAVKVEVTIGSTCWRTSLFPSRELEGYVLPVKATVRRAEKLDDGTIVQLAMHIIR